MKENKISDNILNEMSNKISICLNTDNINYVCFFYFEMATHFDIGILLTTTQTSKYCIVKKKSHTHQTEKKKLFMSTGRAQPSKQQKKCIQ